MLIKAAKHRLGAVATWSQSTDTFGINAINAEISAFKHNFALTVFDNSTYDSIGTKIGVKDTGRIKFAIYFPTDRWDDPNQPGVYPKIPDYDGTVWTQAAIDAGFNVTVGSVKMARYPNHGQELFDISDGLYGYDLVNDLAGTIDVLSGLVTAQREWFNTTFGYYPSAASYRNGKTESAYALQRFLSVRNSDYDTNNVGYDFSHAEALSLPTTSRQGDMAGTREAILATLETSVQKAITENGWFRDFTHWHTIAQPNELHEFFESQRNAIGNSDVISLDFGTALQHKFLSNIATVSAIDNIGTVVVQVAYADPYSTLSLDVFTIPLSVEIDLTGSSLQGKDISSTVGIRKLSVDKYIVEVPFNGVEETVSVTLQEAVNPGYIDLALPIIENCVLSNGTLSVTTDKPTKIVLFEVASGANVYDNPAMITRDNTTSKTHSIAYTANANDLYIGVITEQGQSVLSIANPYESDYSAGYLSTYDQKLALYDMAQDNTLKICINGQSKHFKLVDVADGRASNQHIYVNGEIKAIEKTIS